MLLIERKAMLAGKAHAATRRVKMAEAGAALLCQGERTHVNYEELQKGI